MLRLFSIVTIILGLSLLINIYILVEISVSLGVFSLALSALLFGTALFWQIRLPDPNVHLTRPWLGIPAILMGVASYKISTSGAELLQPMPADLYELGQIMMSRNQALLIVTGLLAAISFVLASQLLRKR
ncbi:MAG: hypothetical protein IT289_12920 [Oligoflexia bacterium]|nr:hypothetical protein [Oligoflexia bacterium]